MAVSMWAPRTKRYFTTRRTSVFVCIQASVAKATTSQEPTEPLSTLVVNAWYHSRFISRESWENTWQRRTLFAAVTPY